MQDSPCGWPENKHAGIKFGENRGKDKQSEDYNIVTREENRRIIVLLQKRNSVRVIMLLLKRNSGGLQCYY